jgi:hypothetical protein
MREAHLDSLLDLIHDRPAATNQPRSVSNLRKLASVVEGAVAPALLAHLLLRVGVDGGGRGGRGEDGVFGREHGGRERWRGVGAAVVGSRDESGGGS